MLSFTLLKENWEKRACYNVRPLRQPYYKGILTNQYYLIQYYTKISMKIYNFIFEIIRVFRIYTIYVELQGLISTIPRVDTFLQFTEHIFRSIEISWLVVQQSYIWLVLSIFPATFCFSVLRIWRIYCKLSLRAKQLNKLIAAVNL